MKMAVTIGLVGLSDKILEIPITLRTEDEGGHKTLSLADDRGGLMVAIPCDDPEIKDMLREVSEWN